jgi:quercetin dioxygenase-like cupin family protein
VDYRETWPGDVVWILRGEKHWHGVTRQQAREAYDGAVFEFKKEIPV